MTFTDEYLNQSKRQEERGRCLHFSDGVRCNEIISAHSIQKSGQLATIAEDGHVYRMSAGLSTLRRTGGLPHPEKIGVRRASTFFGFCKYHDNALFGPIDKKPLRPDKSQIALYAYRCLCRELFVKENAVATLNWMKEHPDVDHKKMKFLQASLKGQKLGLDGLLHHKKHYDEAIQNGRHEEFEFTYFMSTSRCSLQLSGLLYPDFDFLGRHLQNLSDWSSPLAMITFFTAPTDEGWAFGFGWHKSSSQSCIPFIQSLRACVAGGAKFHDVLLRFSFSTCENHAFRISWWDTVAESDKQAVIARMILMIHPGIPIPSNYLVEGLEGIADWEFKYVQTTLHAEA